MVMLPSETVRSPWLLMPLLSEVMSSVVPEDKKRRFEIKFNRSYLSNAVAMIAVESPQPLGEDLEAESPTVYGNAQILQKKSVLIY